jgi:glycosyltransferase involved in cell wall biosynthesis
MKTIIVIPAYNAEKTIESVFKRIPKKSYDEIIVVNDGSKDKTSEIVKKYKVRLIEHKENKGYGGAQKTGFKQALEDGADMIALVHADGQYAPEELPELVKPIRDGEVDVVLGSRVLGGKMLEGKMPLLKFIGNRFLTFVENLVLRMNISEYHTGYRVYSRKALENIRFDLNSDKYEFDSEILIQCKLKKLKIKEIPIQTYYGEEKSYLNPWTYGLRVFKVLLNYVDHRLHIRRDQKYM